MQSYLTLPSHAQWQNDSSVSWARRADDPVLTRIDTLVEVLNLTKAEGELVYLYGELYFATDLWLKDLKLGSKMNKGREPAIHNLFAFVVKRLAEAFDCTIATLPNELELLYGKNLSTYGKEKDKGTHHYMQRALANRFRIYFRNGLAYQEDWCKPKPKLVLAKSSKWFEYTDENKGYQTEKVDTKGNVLSKPKMFRILNEDWAYFVMSMSRDIYMGPHMGKDKFELDEAVKERVISSLAGYYRRPEVATVHSSWLGGTLVQCAGSLYVDEGKVLGIRNNSGHYRPDEPFMLNVLELLRTVGVDISQVGLFNQQGDKLVNGKEFVALHGNIEAIFDRMAKAG